MLWLIYAHQKQDFFQSKDIAAFLNSKFFVASFYGGTYFLIRFHLAVII